MPPWAAQELGDALATLRRWFPSVPLHELADWLTTLPPVVELERGRRC